MFFELAHAPRSMLYVLRQLLVAGSQIFARAFAQAYKEAGHFAWKSEEMGMCLPMRMRMEVDNTQARNADLQPDATDFDYSL